MTAHSIAAFGIEEKRGGARSIYTAADVREHRQR